jgi:hypothetical protein
MRLLIFIIVVVYLVGVGVVLAPVVKGKWYEGTASELSASVVQALPGALTWPATLYRSLRGEGDASPQGPQTKTP